MGVIGDSMRAASGQCFLHNLYAELGITDKRSKTIVAALVMGCLRNNKCGVTHDNEEQIKKELCAGLDEYEFEIADLAGAYDNDLLYILGQHEGHIDQGLFYKAHVWPYLENNEVIPGIHM